MVLQLPIYLIDSNLSPSMALTHSSLLPFSSGVPQGSILGPILFRVYINDLPQCVTKGKVLLFAADTTCFHSISSSSVQADLTNLSNWSAKWKLLFNASKCILIAQTTPSQTTLPVADQTISTKTTHKDLGLLLHNNLNWTNHYNHVCL